MLVSNCFECVSAENYKNKTACDKKVTFYGTRWLGVQQISCFCGSGLDLNPARSECQGGQMILRQ